MTEDLKQKIDMAIERLKAFEPKDGSGYYMAFSGGKDSVTVKALADMAGVKYDAHYRVTSVDPPELVAFIRDFHPDVKREIPRYPDGKPITMWNLILKNKMPPTRLARYCCEKLKEDGGEERKTITGVRWAESVNRAKNQGMLTVPKAEKIGEEVADDLEDAGFERPPRGGYILNNDNAEARKQVEHCFKWSKVVVNPIIDWTDRNVWDFIREYKIPYCKLYDEGFTRLGCIGCPMGPTNQRLEQFRRWPKYEKMYRRVFDKLHEMQSRPDYKGKKWESAEERWNRWLEIEIPTGQIGFDEIMEEEE